MQIHDLRQPKERSFVRAEEPDWRGTRSVVYWTGGVTWDIRGLGKGQGIRAKQGTSDKMVARDKGRRAGLAGDKLSYILN